MEKLILLSKSDWHTGREFVQPERTYQCLFLNCKLEKFPKVGATLTMADPVFPRSGAGSPTP